MKSIPCMLRIHSRAPVKSTDIYRLECRLANEFAPTGGCSVSALGRGASDIALPRGAWERSAELPLPPAPLILIFYRSSPGAAKPDLGAGQTQATRSGSSGMDAARAPSGHGCPFGAGPRSVAGARESDEVGPNQEQAPLVTWGAFPSNPPKAEQLCR